MLVSPQLRRRCDRLRELHVPGDPLVLPNAWDVASARAVVVASLGFDDHERAPVRAMLDAALGRARAYVSAGVDCVYPILLRDEVAIDAFVEGASAPVNILTSRDAPSFERLAAAGVARVSYGSSIHAGTIEELGAFLSGRREQLGRAPAPPRPR